MPKKKWYVVWKGIKPGVYETWDDCKKQVTGFEEAVYKSFTSEQEALEAFRLQPNNFIKREKKNQPAINPGSGNVTIIGLAVDAACSGNPGKMEYRGVCLETRKEIFHAGPYEQATNNIGEFLAVVHGLALLKKQNQNLPVYSDSVNAILWIKNKKCKTKLMPSEKNQVVFDMIRRAELWLENNTFENKILKWKTKEWGEIPADFGRK